LGEGDVAVVERGCALIVAEFKSKQIHRAEVGHIVYLFEPTSYIIGVVHGLQGGLGGFATYVFLHELPKRVVAVVCYTLGGVAVGLGLITS